MTGWLLPDWRHHPCALNPLAGPCCVWWGLRELCCLLPEKDSASLGNSDFVLAQAPEVTGANICSFFFSCSSDWIMPVALSSGSLILSSACSNLLLCSLPEVFMSATVFFSFRISIWCLFIVFFLLIFRVCLDIVFLVSFRSLSVSERVDLKPLILVQCLGFLWEISLLFLLKYMCTFLFLYVLCSFFVGNWMF